MSASLPIRFDVGHYRPAPAAPVRPLPKPSESIWSEIASILPACKDKPPREAARMAEARRHSHASEILAMRIGLRRSPATLARYTGEIRAALDEPLESTRPLTEVLLSTVPEDAEGDIATANLIANTDDPKLLRSYIHQNQEKVGALLISISAAQAKLEGLGQV